MKKFCLWALLLAVLVKCGRTHEYDLSEYRRVRCVHNTVSGSSSQLLFTDRDRNSKKFSGYTTDWYNWQSYVKKLVYRCGLAAKTRGLEYFGIQKRGECWARDFPLGDSYAGRRRRTASRPSEHECIDGNYQVCPRPPRASSVCLGQRYSSFMYRIACKPKVSDLVIAVDASASIGLDMFAKLKDFLKRLAPRLSISGRGTHVVVLGFDQVSRLSAPDFASSSAQSLQGVRAQIDKLAFTQGSTLIQDALHDVKELFSSRGARSYVRPAAILFTDGQTFGGKTLLQQPVENLRQSGAQVHAVGIGARESIDPEALKIITGGDFNVYLPRKYDEDDQLELLKTLCRGQTKGVAGNAKRDGSTDSDSDSDD